MKRLDPSQHVAVSRLAEDSVPYFPLIGAVVLGAQNGVIYANDPDAPTQAYVEHASGFAQILGAPDAQFERQLERYMLIDRAFECPKLRLYAPRMPAFLQTPAVASMRSERQRFHLRARVDVPFEAQRADVAYAVPDATNVGLIEEKFGLVTRFWRSAEDFIGKANGVLVLRHGEPAALCCAAAEVGSRAEIEVATLPAHRKSGLGRAAVLRFIERCIGNSVDPLWDCFTNNEGSMRLARSVGFSPMTPPYAFFTVTK